MKPHLLFACLLAFVLCAGLLAGQAAAADVFHVSPNGDDDAPGTADRPWRTLAHASSRALPGTTILLMDGVYRETLAIKHSGTAGQPVRFIAADQARPVISACDPVTDWETLPDGDLKATLDWDLGPGLNQIFFKGQPLPEARHPNATSSNPMEPGFVTVSIPDKTSLSSKAFQSERRDVWKGAWFLGHGDKAWSMQSARVASSEEDRIHLVPESVSHPWFTDGDTPGDPAAATGLSAGFLFGLASMIDSPGEWILENGSIRLRPPAGFAVANRHAIEVKRRPWTLEIEDHQHVEIRGITFVGGALRIMGSHLVVDRCIVRHASHFLTFKSGYSQDGGRPEGAAIELGGSDNRLTRCEISFNAGCGILVSGLRNEVIRCLIKDVSYAGTYGAGITIASEDATITFNTIRRTGRDGIHFVNIGSGAGVGATVTYNDVAFPGMICRDAGIIYAFGQNGTSRSGRPTRIAWNWFHDHHAPRPSPGIYLDNYCRNFLVHHNVVWNVPNDAGIRVNGPSDGCRVFQNTLFHTHDVGSFTFHRFEEQNPEPGFWKGRDHYSFENLNNLHLGDDPASQLKDPANLDFTLRDNAPAIDAGVIIADAPPEVTGTRPDLGAYEKGLPVWIPGHRGHAPAGSSAGSLNHRIPAPSLP